MHPSLLWNDILAASTAVLEQDAMRRSYPVLPKIHEIPGLEVAGRSRKNDFSAAWNERWRRLAEGSTGFYISVTEFETPASRLGFGP